MQLCNASPLYDLAATSAALCSDVWFVAHRCSCIRR